MAREVLQLTFLGGEVLGFPQGPTSLKVTNKTAILQPFKCHIRQLSANEVAREAGPDIP